MWDGSFNIPASYDKAKSLEAEELAGYLMDFDTQIPDFVFIDRISQILLDSQMR